MNSIPTQASNSAPAKKHKFYESFRAILWAIVIAFILRGFVVEAFKIPSGSMIPTLLVGDHLFVSKLSYGVRLPFTKKWIWRYDTPKRGEVVVFFYPKNESDDYIKRVIGVAGDKIVFKGQEIFVNGEPLVKHLASPLSPAEPNPSKLYFQAEGSEDWRKKFAWLTYDSEWKNHFYFIEKIGDVYHWIQHFSMPQANKEYIVPEGHLFVMGDNRDNSSDSRVWGFVPVENVIGKALFIWLPLHYEPDATSVRGDRYDFIWKAPLRWERFFKSIQ